MLAPSHRPSGQPVSLPVQEEPRVAVLLNANAKKVDDKVIRRVSHVVPEEDLFLSRTLEDCDAIAKKVVDRRYHTVFTGGGDGTFVAFVNRIHQEMAERGIVRGPRFGVLKLGTGNALASLVGASALSGDGILDDILRARANEVPSVRRLDLITIDGRMTPFAGVGYDAAIVNDYVAVKESWAPARKLLAGPAGYAAAIALKTLPGYLKRSAKVQAELVSDGRSMRIAPDGTVLESYEKGAVLYRGPLDILCAGTAPFYGFGYRMFPHALRKRGFMHLRAADVPPLVCAMNVTKLWDGSFTHPGLHDFLTEGVTARFERPMPFQIGGDAGGYRKELSLGVADRSIELVDFSPSLH